MSLAAIALGFPPAFVHPAGVASAGLVEVSCAYTAATIKSSTANPVGFVTVTEALLLDEPVCDDSITTDIFTLH